MDQVYVLGSTVKSRQCVMTIPLKDEGGGGVGGGGGGGGGGGRRGPALTIGLAVQSTVSHLRTASASDRADVVIQVKAGHRFVTVRVRVLCCAWLLCVRTCGRTVRACIRGWVAGRWLWRGEQRFFSLIASR